MKSPKIILSRAVNSVSLDAGPRTLCVHHAAYKTPQILGDVLEFSEFAKRPRELLRGVDRLVVVGLNKIIGPSNRTAEVFEVLFNNTPDLHKVSIDTDLFTADPWRLWFHWGLTNSFFDGYTYSYLVESHFNSWLDGVRESNPVGAESVLRNGRDVVACDFTQAFQPLSVTIIETSAAAKQRYQEAKTVAFEQCTSARQVIARLSKVAQDEIPQRSVPKLSALSRTEPNSVVATDLKVDDFLVSRLQHDVGVCNDVAREFYSGC